MRKVLLAVCACTFMFACNPIVDGKVMTIKYNSQGCKCNIAFYTENRTMDEDFWIKCDSSFHVGDKVEFKAVPQ